MNQITASPLTAEAFAPFGQVLQTEGSLYQQLNAGQARRYPDLAQLSATGPGGRLAVSIVRSAHRELPWRLTFVERHPFGSQAFMPLSPRPFLVVVAPDENGVAGAPRAFLTRPGQGINLNINTWHGVLTPLEAESEFFVVDRHGEGDNLEIHTYGEPWLIDIPRA